MTYTRDNGSTTSTLAGFCAFGGLQINDGTFKSARLGMLTGQPPIQSDGTDLPNDDGAFDGFPLYGGWRFTLEGWLYVPTTDYVQDAIDDLHDVFNLHTGLGTLTFKKRVGSTLYRMLARVDGDGVIVTDPGRGRRKTRQRDFSVPMFAPDPRAYNADSEHGVTIAVGATGSLANNGNYPTPFEVELVGPLTNPILNGPGTGNVIRLLNADGTDYVLASGHSVTVQTNPSAPDGVTALDETGASVYSVVGARSANVINPGTSAWLFDADAGSGHAVVTYRDARI